ncbi:serine/threonine-protein kinase [Nocardioides caricicola]|uniref:non-specific serine/threonine protein kinase n=1 Tax=Nocardioides caricicola TaxID=634770 RepID=A0ABW0MVZ4_9ACTN
MPSRLGRYAVRRRIGSGAFATVWLAYDEQLDSPVAIKVLAENWTEDQQVRQRFLEEGRFLRKVESPYVVSVYDAGELEDGRPYLVMSYADQGTLADRLGVEGLSTAQALEVVRQVGAGLQALHERGVLHRDVKPANVLFRADGDTVRAMVADLGLGKALDVSSRLTMIAGTPSFVAPEQAQGEPLDPRSDLYSLAALTYLLLCGTAPYAHASLSAAAAPGPPPPLVATRLPAEVEAVVHRGLAPDREDRWPDVATYVDALAAALGPEATAVRSGPWLPPDPQLTQPGARPTALPSEDPLPPLGRPRRSRARYAAAAVGLLVLAAAGLAVGYVVSDRDPDELTVDDETGTLSVTVPHDWADTVADGWRPPNQPTEVPAIAVGTSEDWQRDEDGEGVFVSLLTETDLPDQVPQHPECARVDEPITDADSETVFYRDCPAGVIVERVVQLTTNRLLWVQVRSDDTATANRVLDDVEAHGFG